MNKSTLINALLLRIERAGNKLPHPTMLFIYLCAVVLIISAIAAALGTSAVHPISGETITSVNLLSRDGLHLIIGKAVTNFTQFAPVGAVLVAIMGIGVAESSGLLGAALRAVVHKAPPRSLSFIVVLTGVLTSVAADTGYVVLIPLAAMVFVSAGRHPLAGIAAAFAGVSGGFSANLLIGPTDAILAGLSTEAAALIRPDYVVSAAGNYYFLVVSTLLISVIGAWITDKIVSPRLGDYVPTDHETDHRATDRERMALRATGIFSLIFIGLILIAVVPPEGILRADDGGVLRSPFISGVVVIIALYAALAGLVYGKVSGKFTNSTDFIKSMESSMATMAGYLVLMFFAAQFVSYFNWSQLGAIAAINGAGILKSMDVGTTTLMICFIIMSASINLLIGSASAKWALFAPIFVPMFLLLGISPEGTQIAYRIGDSTTNIITPLMPYFGIIVAFAQKYQRDIGIGTIIATMLPYSVSLLLGWSILLVIWIAMGWPLGPGAAVLL